MIRTMNWIDIDGPVLYEAMRDIDNPDRWTLVRLAVGAQREPEGIPGELMLRDVSLAQVYAAMQAVVDKVDSPEDDDEG